MLQSTTKTTGRFVGERARATRATGRCCHDILQTSVLHWITDHYVGVLARITLLLGSWELAVGSIQYNDTWYWCTSIAGAIGHSAIHAQ